jgi:ATP-binding cassette subfamily B protein
MPKLEEENWDIKVVSALPGRVRWEVRGLRGRKNFAAIIEQQVANKPGITQLSASHVTGRVLIFFDPNVPAEAIRGYVRDAMVAAQFPAPLARGEVAVSGLNDLREAARFVSPFRTDLLIAAGLSALAALCNIGRYVAMGWAVDAIRTGRPPGIPFLRRRSVVTSTVVLGAVALGLVACVGIFKYASLRIWRRRGRLLQHQLRTQVFAHVQHMQMATLQESGRGELLAVLSEDVDRIESAFDAASWLTDVSIASAVFIAALFIVAPQQGWVALLPIPILVGRAIAFYPRLRAGYAKARQNAALIMGHVRSNLDGISTVKSFMLEAPEEKAAEVLSNRYRESSQAASAMATAFPLTLEGTIQAGVVVTILAGRSLPTPAGGVSVGTYTSVLMLLYHVFYPLGSLSFPLDNLERGLTAYARVQKILSLPLESDDNREEIAPESVRGEIVYEDVDFSYPNGAHVFNKLSLTFAPGSTTAIVGPSGSGKSTLVNLLLGFFPLQSGRILLDGEDIRQMKRSSLRRLVSIVSQDVYLFPRTIMENIRVGKPEASYEEVVSAAKLANAHDFIMQLPQGYDTPIGDRGEKLSGGQKQRIAIARALLKDAPILILDEGTSHLHPRMEDELQAVLRQAYSGRTLIIITHRLSSASNEDLIYVLEKGLIVEQGTRLELVESEGEFENLGFAEP